MNKFKEISEEVLVQTSHLSDINKININYLIEKAKKSKSKKYRLCIHKNSTQPVHEMFIIHPYDMYVRPHKHINKSESMLVLSGEADYIIFDNKGKISQKIPLGDFNSGKQFYINIKTSLYHSITINSEWLVFLEITKGPFNRNDTIFPDWAPDSEDKKAVKKFMSLLHLGLKNEKL